MAPCFSSLPTADAKPPGSAVFPLSKRRVVIVVAVFHGRLDLGAWS